MAALAAGAQPAAAAVPDLERTSATELAPSSRPGELTSVELDEGLHRPDRRGQPARTFDQRRPLAEPGCAARRRACPTSRAAPTASAARSRACRSCSRTTSTSPGCRRPRPRSCSSTRVPDKDAFVVQRLKAAGAVILGKVNLTEFAAWVSNNQSSGNGSLHGQVLNPYDTSTDPGGSSSGSGVAAAAGLAALVIGSDTEGSILSPAGQNGVVGIRPTTGLWSRTGVVPISESQDTLGPLDADHERRGAAAERADRRRPGGPAHRRHGAGRGHRLPRRPEGGRAAGRADRRQQLRQRAVRRRAQRAGEPRRDDRP